MVRVGQKVRFDPQAHATGFGAADERGRKVPGTVTMVNEKHKWFMAEYSEHKLRIWFKFCDIPERVQICE